MKKFLRWTSVGYLSSLFLLVIFLPMIFPSEEWQTKMEQVLAVPSWNSILGRDSLGRDVFLRMIFGARISLVTGLIAALIAISLGAIYGLISAYSREWIDDVLMRTVEVLMGLPNLIIMSLVILIFPSSWSSSILLQVALAIGLGSWMSFARLIRNLARKEKSLLYIESAKALGASPTRILFIHILPNVFPAVLVMFGLQLPNYLLAESLLTFVGIGLQPPWASWGMLIQEGWKTLSSYPHLILGPSLFLFATIFSFNIIFEDLRLRLDPKLRWDRR